MLRLQAGLAVCAQEICQSPALESEKVAGDISYEKVTKKGKSRFEPPWRSRSRPFDA